MNTNILKDLIQEGENARIEFKRELSLATAENKGKFLKEVLALNNTLQSPTYLIIGVEDKTKHLVGIPPLKEEQFQQIISEYCKPPIRFTYSELTVEDVLLGVFEFSRTPFKPYTLKKPYSYLDAKGKQQILTENQVFIRRGTIVNVATIEEVLELAQDHDTNLELLSGAVDGIDTIAGKISNVSYQLEAITDQLRYTRHARNRTTPPERDIVFIALLTGGAASVILDLQDPYAWLFVALLWFGFSIVAAVLQLIQQSVIRSTLYTLFFGLMLAGMLVTVSTIPLPFSSGVNAPFMALFIGILVGGVTGLGQAWLYNIIASKFE